MPTAHAETYTGRDGGFELFAARQKAEDYTCEALGVPTLIPAGDGMALALRHDQKYTATIWPTGSPRSAEKLAERLVYGLYHQIRPVMWMDNTDIPKALEDLEARKNEAAEWIVRVRPMLEDAVAALGLDGGD